MFREGGIILIVFSFFVGSIVSLDNTHDITDYQPQCNKKCKVGPARLSFQKLEGSSSVDRECFLVLTQSFVRYLAADLVLCHVKRKILLNWPTSMLF